jgi:hypothetical protein
MRPDGAVIGGPDRGFVPIAAQHASLARLVRGLLAYVSE